MHVFPQRSRWPSSVGSDSRVDAQCTSPGQPGITKQQQQPARAKSGKRLPMGRRTFGLRGRAPNPRGWAPPCLWQHGACQGRVRAPPPPPRPTSGFLPEEAAEALPCLLPFRSGACSKMAAPERPAGGAAEATSGFLGFGPSSRDPGRQRSRRAGGLGARSRKKGWKRWRGPEAQLGRDLGCWLEEAAADLRQLGSAPGGPSGGAWAWAGRSGGGQWRAMPVRGCRRKAVTWGFLNGDTGAAIGGIPVTPTSPQGEHPTPHTATVCLCDVQHLGIVGVDSLHPFQDRDWARWDGPMSRCATPPPMAAVAGDPLKAPPTSPSAGPM